MTGEVNNDVKIGGLRASIPAKIEAGKKMAELRTKAIEINKQLNDVIGKLPAEVQEAYHAYKRLDNAEEKLEEITEKAYFEGKIPDSEVTAQAQEVENLKKELAKLEAKIPENYKEIYNTVKNY